MALGKGSKMDPRRSSSNYSAATVVVFVALCLIGAWMMTSSTMVPSGMSSSEPNSNVKQQISETNGRSYEDSSGDVPDEEIRNEDVDTGTKDSLVETKSENDKNVPMKMDESSVEKIQEGNPDQSNEDKINESDNTSGTGTYSDENGKTEGGEIIKEGTEKTEGGQEEGQDKSIDQSSQEKNENQKSDETVSEEQIMKSEQSLTGKTDDKQKFSDEKKVSEEEKNNDNSMQDGNDQSQTEEKYEGNKDNAAEENSEEKKEQTSNEGFPDGAQSELLNETNTQNGAWATQAAESKNEKQVQDAALSTEESSGYSWKLCNVTAGADYIPCLDNEEAIRNLRSTKHYEHRERHCPDQAPTCLVPLPEGYKIPIQWPNSRNKIWYYNVPHTKLATVKGHQNWVKVTGEYLTFPGGGTQFKHGALHYIDFIQESLSNISWGKRSRVVLDVGCGVASFGGFLFDRDVLAMSLAPKDEHEAQVQFALERGIPALSAVMGTQRLPFPSRVFDVVHCARCRVPWHIEGGKLLLELNRLLRPGGYFVWSATPVYQKLPEDVEIWKAMSALTKQMCWKMINKTKEPLNHVGLAIFRKPSDNKCYEKRSESNPPLCQESDDPNAAWNVPLQACMHKLPVDPSTRGSKWPEKWPKRLEKTPYWLNSSQVGVYGQPAPEDFQADYEHWKHVISNSYMNGMGIDWSTVRNVMDMRAAYGGFAAALKNMKIWVMNIVTIDSPDTLPVIYERGLFGMYHDWCESFSTYPRTYDLLHADHLFSQITNRCKLQSVFAEVDRILRPEGKLIVRDSTEIINEIESMAKSLQWEIRMTYSKNKEGLLCVKKTMWRPTEVETTVSPLS